MGDVFCWMFDHINILKLEKDIQDDSRYSVLQINIVCCKKYSCAETCILNREYSSNPVPALPVAAVAGHYWPVLCH